MFLESSSGRVRVDAGLHFGSEFLGGDETGRIYELLPSGFHNRVLNAHDFLGMYIFDVWTEHCDHRQPLFLTTKNSRFLKAIFVDNGHLLGGPSWKLDSRPGEALCLNPNLYTTKWTEESIEKWIFHIETRASPALQTLMQRVPRVWSSENSDDVIEKLITRLNELRSLFAQEIKSNRRIIRPSQVDLPDVQLAVRCVELSPNRGLKKRSTSRVIAIA
jgi:hypothetical protein